VKRSAKHTQARTDFEHLQAQLQQAVRHGGTTLAQILEAVPVGIFVIDAAGKPFYANKIAQNLLGRGIAPDAGPEELAETYHAYLAGTSTQYPSSRMPVVRALSGETAVVTDMEIHHPHQVIPLQVWGAPIVDEKGSIVYAIAAFSDISERKEAERRLSSQYDVARGLAEAPSLHDAAPRILEAIGTIAQWDHAALWRVDFAAEVLRCVGLWQRPGHEAPRFAEVTRSMTYRQGSGLPGVVWQKRSFEWMVERNPLAAFPISAEVRRSDYHSAAAFPIMFGSRVLGVIEFMSRELRESDAELVRMMEAHGSQIGQFIEREQAEQDLRRAKEDAEREARSKADFLAIMSHEIRTPMNAVTGMTGLLLETALSRQQREFAQMAQISAESLLSVINDILDFSRIESGNLTLELHPFELNTCIEEVFDLVAHQALQKRIDLVSSIDPAVPDFIKGDSTRLRQVLVNLVNNAIKFTDSGHVFISVRRMDHVAGQEDVLEFTVEDTGVGISTEHAAQLFKPFTQADSSTTRKHGGTGLGLAICKKLVDLMGGLIAVESSPGKGARFIFTIQAREASGVSKRYIGKDIPELTGKKVLIVDGSSPSVAVLADHVRRWGMHPLEASSPKKARQLIEQGTTFDLVLIDMRDEDDASLALAQELRNAPSGAGPPMVLLSFLGMQEEIVEKSSDLFAAVMSKPVKKSQLFDVIMEAISGVGSGRSLHTIRRLDPRLSEKIPLRILVAEDNTMNQKLMLLVLRQMGYDADIAENGVDVLAKLERQPYDIIFMDVEMPEMDGLEATRRILELKPGGERPIIVGTTAYGLAGDEHECLDAGMHDCINKPIRIEQIQDCLLRWGEPWASEAGKQRTSHPEAIDQERIAELEEMERRAKKNLIQELVTVYLEDLPVMLAAVQNGLASGDVAAAGKAAHRLKGTSLNVGANALADVCRIIESKARAGDSKGLPELLPDLEQQVRDAGEALRALLARRR